MRNFLWVVFFAFVLNGCSLFSPVKVEENTYMLTAAPQINGHRLHRHAVLVVASVDADPIYNSSEMLYSTQLYKISYYSKNRWVEPPTQMLQSLLVQTLQNTHAFASVSAAPSIGSYDYVLNTRLLELQQVFYGRFSLVRMSVRVQIVNAATNRVIASKQFSTAVPTHQLTPYGGVVAANRATSEILRQVALFCLRVI